MIGVQSKVQLKDESIRFGSKDQSGWELSVEEIRVIIEYTTEDGPFAPDHFLVFVNRSGTEYHLPLEAEGCLEVAEQVGKALEADIDLKLSTSTNFASRVVFPDSIAGVEGYKLEKTKQTLTQRLFHLGQEVRMILSDEVRRSLS